MRITRATASRCERCKKRIPAWWFKAGDQQGWWHWHCIIIDQWRRENG